MCTFFHFYIYTYTPVPFYYNSKERMFSALPFIFNTYFTYISYFSSYLKKNNISDKISTSPNLIKIDTLTFTVFLNMNLASVL